MTAAIDRLPRTLRTLKIGEIADDALGLALATSPRLARLTTLELPRELARSTMEKLRARWRVITLQDRYEDADE